MIEKNIVVAALARNCNDALVRNIPKVEDLCSHFKSHHIVVVENDSTDGTKETLGHWAKSSPTVTIISQDYGTETIAPATTKEPRPAFGLRRIEKMAKYRNIYLDFVRQSTMDVDYFLIIDIDIEDFDVTGVLESIRTAPDNWAALFAFGLMDDLYYDMFAYRHTDCDEPFTLKRLSKRRRSVTKRVRREGYSSCASAFSGIGLYKWRYIKDLSYAAQPNVEDHPYIKAVCEHVPLHHSIRANHPNCALYVSQSMRVNYGKTTLVERLKRRCVPLFVRKLFLFLRR